MTLQDIKFEIKWAFRQLAEPFRDYLVGLREAKQRKAAQRAIRSASPWFQDFLIRLENNDVADRTILRGCSESEIQMLERHYEVTLPARYREFLSLMGHKAGRLFTHDHLAVFYPYVMKNTEKALSWFIQQKWMHDRNPPVPDDFIWPDEGVFIEARLGEDWHFIRCDHPDESPVWLIDGESWQIVKVYPSITDWLSAQCQACEAAIASGFFYEHPNGTTP